MALATCCSSGWVGDLGRECLGGRTRNIILSRWDNFYHGAGNLLQQWVGWRSWSGMFGWAYTEYYLEPLGQFLPWRWHLAAAVVGLAILVGNVWVGVHGILS